jgi:hypothetical protein
LGVNELYLFFLEPFLILLYALKKS